MVKRMTARESFLTKSGFLPNEVVEFADQYSVHDMRTLPYWIDLRRWRQLYIANLKYRGYTEAQIESAIKRLYPDPWAMLRRFRKPHEKDKGGASPTYPPRKGSHHSKARGWSAGDRAGQKRRAKAEKQLSPAMRGDKNAWIEQMEESRQQALASGNERRARDLERRIFNLRGY